MGIVGVGFVFANADVSYAKKVNLRVRSELIHEQHIVLSIYNENKEHQTKHTKGLCNIITTVIMKDKSCFVS